MIIQNYTNLAKNQNLRAVLQILEAGLTAANPDNFMKKFVKKNQINAGKKPISLSKYENVYSVAFGKAADSMTKAVDSLTRVKSGIIVIPTGSKAIIKIRKFKILHSGHPLPSKTSVSSANAIVSFLKQRKPDDYVIFLVSGGTSSLLAIPDGISLAQKARTSGLLLSSGATIGEINCVRKHLSKIKGGRLLEKLPCDAISLVMSDVVGNDLSSIASGTTYCDTTTFSGALQIIRKYKLEHKIPKQALKRLKLGAAGKILETPKKPKIANYIVATNNDCVAAMKKKANQLGLQVKTVTVSGNIKTAAKKLTSLIPKKKGCLIFGGETTVQVKGGGLGGRSQELVLRILYKSSESNAKMVIASLGTDGIDGNTKYAGAIIENIDAMPDEIKSYLQHNDSNSFFKKYAGLIRTGHTHTNLLDIGLIYK